MNMSDSVESASQENQWRSVANAGQFLSQAVDLVWPPVCAFCKHGLNVGDGLTERVRLCAACCEAFTFDDRDACFHCGAPIGPFLDPTHKCAVCVVELFRFCQVFRIGLYDKELREACIRGKSAGSETLPVALASFLWQLEQQRMCDFAPDLVVSVPQHWRHWLTRTHHQATTIGESLASELGVPLRTDVVRKVRYTVDQSSLAGTARRTNLRNAFGVSRRGAQLVSGRRILLTDDVFTTGSTVNTITKVLLKAGAREVAVAVLAVVPP
jgi:ComF family protein